MSNKPSRSKFLGTRRRGDPHLPSGLATDLMGADGVGRSRESLFGWMDAYDSAGGTDISSAFTTIPLATLRVETEQFSHNVSGEITINQDGEYLVMLDCGVQLTAGTASNGQCKIQQDVGAGFVDVPGTLSMGTTLGITSSGASANARCFLTLKDGDKIRAQAIRQSGSGTVKLMADHSRLVILRLG